jgi:hypothetical protein
MGKTLSNEGLGYLWKKIKGQVATGNISDETYVSEAFKEVYPNVEKVEEEQ